MRESHRLVYQVAYSVPGSAADAEEVTQDTFLTAYRKFDSLRDPERFRPWVARASSPPTGKRRQFRDRNSQTHKIGCPRKLLYRFRALLAIVMK
jgi:RNA polymerase sigma-70 factor (ECF subfamily)